MKKLTMVILLAAVVFCAFAGCKSQLDESDLPESFPKEQESESAPKKPTASEAAKHNEAIDPSGVLLIQFEAPTAGDEIAVISTRVGDIRIRLFREQAPETVGAFIELVKEGYYNGGEFSESVDGYKLDGAGKLDDAVFPEEEFSLDLWNFRGAVAVSNNGGNFMIVTADHCLNTREELEEVNFPRTVIKKYLDIGGAPHQDWKNTVFGQVIDGMEFAETLASEPAGERTAITGISMEIY